MPVPRISKEDLKARLEGEPAQRPVILDVRLKYPYEHSTLTLPGAVRVAPEQVAGARLDRQRDVVTFDSDPEEVTGSHAAAELIRLGFRASVLKGGLAEWVGASFPVETKESARPAAPAPAAKG